MNKKIIGIMICILILIGGIIWYFALTGNHEKTIDPTNTNTQKEENATIENKDSSKVAVIYFSATGNTKKIAEYIKNETKGEIIEIVPKEKYTQEDLSYNNKNCRANQEQQDEKARPEIANSIDVTKFDTLFLGYPIWWGDVPKIILTFIDQNQLEGKKVIPFCTSASTGIAQSQNTLKSYYKEMNLQEGKRFSSSTTQEEISSWIKELEIE